MMVKGRSAYRGDLEDRNWRYPVIHKPSEPAWSSLQAAIRTALGAVEPWPRVTAMAGPCAAY